jgi:hypothetical protein
VSRDRRPRTGALGAALCGSRLTVARGAGSRGDTDAVWSAPVDQEPATRRDSLTAALLALREEAPDVAALHIALLPPLAEVRAVALPALPVEELLTGVARDASRYFPVGTARQVVRVNELGARGATNASDARDSRDSHDSRDSSDTADDARGSTHLVATTDEALVDDLFAAADAAGWTIASLVPAAQAWAAAARRLNKARTATSALVTTDGRVDQLALGTEGLRGVRRSPASSSRNGSAPPHGAAVLAPDADAARLLAARHAELPDEFSLWPAQVYESRRARLTRQARALLAAAIALLAIAGLVEWSNLRRAESTIAAQRTALRDVVGTALERRDALRAQLGTVELIRSFETETPGWLALLGAVEAALPVDASLRSLRAFGDTIVLIGDADRAAPVMAALATVPELEGLRVDAPIQQQVEDGEVISERFQLRALRRRGGSR